jgi:hypothetical protein
MRARPRSRPHPPTPREVGVNIIQSALGPLVGAAGCPHIFLLIVHTLNARTNPAKTAQTGLALAPYQDHAGLERTLSRQNFERKPPEFGA